MCQVEPADSVNVYELLRFEKIVATKAALEKLGARLGRADERSYTVVKTRARHGKGQRPNGSVESISGRGREAREQIDVKRAVEQLFKVKCCA